MIQLEVTQNHCLLKIKLKTNNVGLVLLIVLTVLISLRLEIKKRLIRKRGKAFYFTIISSIRDATEAKVKSKTD